VDEQVTGNVGGVSAVGRMSQNSSSGLIPRQEVLRRTSLSKRSLWRYIAADLFPRPVPIGPGRVAWLEAEVEAWIAGCVGKRDKDKDVARPQCRLWKEPTRLGQQFKMDLAEARQALHDARYDLAACSCSRAAERLIAAQGDRDSDAATLVAFLRTLAEKLHAFLNGTPPRKRTGRIGAPRKWDHPAIVAYVTEQLRQTPDLKRTSIYQDAATKFDCSISTVYLAIRNDRSIKGY
jgi:prophage regulatory protein